MLEKYRYHHRILVVTEYNFIEFKYYTADNDYYTWLTSAIIIITQNWVKLYKYAFISEII